MGAGGRGGREGLKPLARRAVLFDMGGPIDMEFAYEIAVEGAIAAACGMEGIRVDQAAIDAASERAVEAFAPDARAYMIETLCGDPRTVERVRQRVHAMVANLDVFQLRPGIDDLLRKLRKLDLRLGLVAHQPDRAREALERAGVIDLFEHVSPSVAAAAEALGVAPGACIMVGDRLDADIAPAKALGMATIRFRTGRHRRQKPRSPAETPDAEVTDVAELEAAIERCRNSGLR
ncbi:MAG TPA: HAD hydrolase-like protein [Reyranella sp.]|jgi:beta-phosphoglucomutase-like phosphatase (HAD superfamily)|nr:HAD hydrolase-like protein [Reyranella sp.]